MSQNPPTAKQGIRGALSSEQMAALKNDQERAPTETKVSPPSSGVPEARANDAGQEMLNPSASQGSPAVDATDPPEQPFGDGLSSDDGNEVIGLVGEGRRAFIIESLAGYRTTLIGLRTRLNHELSNGFAGALNPEGQRVAAQESLRQIRLGIAKANALLSELGSDRDQVEA